MLLRCDTYTGGEHYWIRDSKGTFEVRRETHEVEPDNETVFTGSHSACVEWLRKAQESNADYDLNL